MKDKTLSKAIGIAFVFVTGFLAVHKTDDTAYAQPQLLDYRMPADLQLGMLKNQIQSLLNGRDTIWKVHEVERIKEVPRIITIHDTVEVPLLFIASPHASDVTSDEENKPMIVTEKCAAETGLCDSI